MPTVSVVIPNYRGGPLLREAVDSVQAQTFTDWELVIVSDGCEEDLSDLARGDQRIRLFHQRNRGVSIARNVGVSLARSELVALLDDDDRMLPDRLRAQSKAMEDSEVGLCHTQFELIDEHGVVTDVGSSTNAQYRDFLKGDGTILLSSTMIRRTLFNEVGGFNPLLPLSQDLDLIYRIARESRVSFLPEVLAQYRRHGTNTWAQTALGGEEYKLVLNEHLFVATSRGEVDNIRAIRQGLRLVSTGRAAVSIQKARRAQLRGRRLEMLMSLAVAFVLAPRTTLGLSLRQARRSKNGERAR